MTQVRCRQLIDTLDLPVPYLQKLVTQNQIPAICDRSADDWQRLESLLKAPLTIELNGWTYYEVYDTVVQLFHSTSRNCRIRAPGMPCETVSRRECHHPYSEKAGGARRWNLEEQL